jgi:ABC-type ATPase with predicted acetyltransferase domain
LGEPEQETGQKPTSNPDPAELRNSLFAYLGHAIRLSQGEKMRVDIVRASCLEKPLIVFDEFTSVVDREIAKVSAFAISKAVRRSTKKFIAVTCHYDVVDWLDPD